MMLAVKPQEVELAPDHSWCWIHFSHQSFDDFSRTECFDHWKISKVFEAAGHFAMSTDVLSLDKIVSEQSTIFALGVQYQIVPELWTLRVGTVFPYKISVEISELGRTSVTVYSEMVNKLNNQTLASAHCKFVHVDRTTRKPAPFPDWYTQKYAGIAMRQKRPLTLIRTVPQVPETAYCYKLEVSASDTDFNWHTNQGSYVRFCCDAAHAALRAQAVSGFEQDIARYPLIEQQVVYMGESDVGDQLQVRVWQPADQENKIHFVITRHTPGKQPSVIFQAYMIFQMRQLALPHFARM